MNGVVGIPQRKRWRIEPRYKIVIACFLATFTAYVERVGFSIAFTTLAKEAGLDEGTKGTVLSAFYWGYAVSQVLIARFPACIPFDGSNEAAALPCLPCTTSDDPTPLARLCA